MRLTLIHTKIIHMIVSMRIEETYICYAKTKKNSNGMRIFTIDLQSS